MVGGVFSRVILGSRKSVMFKALIGRNHLSAYNNNNNKGAWVGVHILHKLSQPLSLLYSFSRRFSSTPANYNHISNGLSDEPDSDEPCLDLISSKAVEQRPDWLSYGIDCISKPLVQIFSAHIHTNFGDESKRPCEIYGSIQVNEEQGPNFNKVYDRDQAHSEPSMIFNHGILTLSSPKYGPIACNVHSDTTVDVCIKDKTRDVVVVEGKHILRSKAGEIEDSFDKLMNAVVRGEHGYLSLYYTIFRFGVVANVSVKILKSKRHDASCSSVNVHGSIIASYVNADKYCRTNDEAKHMKTSLFNKAADQPALTLVDTDIELSSCAVVVPSYSTLKIQVDLSDTQGQFVSGCAEIFPITFAVVTEQIDGESGSILVQVLWRRAYVPFSRVVPPIDYIPEGKEERYWPIQGHRVVEVFSIYVEGLSHAIRALCGEIKYGDLLVYQRDISDPDLLSENKSIISVGCDLPHCGWEQFDIDIRLYDPILGIEVSKGCITWSNSKLVSMPLYNQRLCSVVSSGKYGYAAVYYSIFDYACQAIMGIKFMSNTDTSANIYGCIVARYDDDYEDYTSNYEKKYYQSRLFDVPQAESLQLTTNSEIPLLKYIVAVPVDSSLVIEADLRSVNQEDEEVLAGVIKFDQVLRFPTRRQEIRGQNCSIEVSVKFRDAFDVRSAFIGKGDIPAIEPFLPGFRTRVMWDD